MLLLSLVTAIITKELLTPRAAKRLVWVLGIGTVLAVCAVFWPVLHADFLAWGDDGNIYRNEHIHGVSSQNLKWMFAENRPGLGYQPLSWLTWAATWSAAGSRPLAYHFLNLLVHCLNAAMLFLVTAKLLRVWAADRWSVAYHRRTYVASAVASVVWALHPLRVEPVAWASGLPYGLALFFALLSLFFYVHPYLHHHSTSKARILYWLAFVCFAVALLSCPILVTYPVVVMLIDRYGPVGGILRRGILRPAHVPFLLASGSVLVASMMARYSQTHGPWTSLFHVDPLGILRGAMRAFNVATYYLLKVWWPHPLSAVDPTVGDFSPLAPSSLASAAAVVVGTYVLFRLRGQWPTPSRLWIAYLVLLLPVLWLMEGPDFPVDRRTFVASLVWAWLLAGVLYQFCLRSTVRTATYAASVVVIAILGGLSARQIAVWQNSGSLFTHVLRTTPPASLHHSRAAIMFGGILVQHGMRAEALRVLNEHLAGAPDDAEGHHVAAGWYFDSGELEKAQFHYREAARLRPTEPRFYNDLGVLLATRGEKIVAQDIFERALAVDPYYPVAHHNLGLLLNEQGKTDEAAALFAKAQALRRMKD